MEQITYQIIPMTGKPKQLASHLELAQELKAMRNSMRGYFVYEITEQDAVRYRRFLTGWNPRV